MSNPTVAFCAWARSANLLLDEMDDDQVTPAVALFNAITASEKAKAVAGRRYSDEDLCELIGDILEIQCDQWMLDEIVAASDVICDCDGFIGFGDASHLVLVATRLQARGKLPSMQLSAPGSDFGHDWSGT